MAVLLSTNHLTGGGRSKGLFSWGGGGEVALLHPNARRAIPPQPGAVRIFLPPASVASHGFAHLAAPHPMALTALYRSS